MKFRILATCFLLAATSVSCARKENSPGPSPDHQINTLKSAPDWQRPTDCRANIKTAICLVDPNKPGDDALASLNRPCALDSARYAAAFEELYDAYPPALQHMFCSLRRIFVEKNFGATAYAASFVSPDGTPIEGAAIGVRQSLLDQKFSISHWATWKEQLSFGGNPKDYTLLMPYPKLDVASEGSLDFMYFVFAHEFGHLFDFKNQVNQFMSDANCNEADGCPSRPGSWSSISWSSSRKRRLDVEFTHSNGLCFYSCTSTMSQNEATELYLNFQKSNFMSTYASTNPWDDFAETMAYYALKTTLNKQIILTFADAASFNATARLDDSNLRPKLDYLKSFLANSPSYP